MLHTSNTFVSYNYPPEEADVLFIGIPFVSTSISRPARFGPAIVRETLKLMSGSHGDIDIFSRFRFCDLGDLEIVEGSYEKTAERIRDTIASFRDANPSAFPVFIGGEHSITLPIAEVLKPKTIVQFDSHADLMSHYKGNEYTHGTWAFHASKISKIVQAGVRVLEEEERKNAHNVLVMKTAEELAEIKFERPVHLTVDMDVFDPSYVETGFPEGRMTPQEFFAFLHHVKPDSMDIVEIADDRFVSRSGWLAAEIIKNVLGRRMG